MTRRAPQRRPKQLTRLSVVPLRLTSYRAGAAAARHSSMASTPLPLPADKQPTRRAFPLAVLGRHGKQAQPAALPELRASIAPERLTLSLPVPPSINHQYATVNGRRLLSAAGRQYKAVVGQQVLIALARSPHRAPLLRALRANDLALSIRFYFVSPLRRDVDGGLKIAQDALCEALGLNDNRVAEIYLYKTRDAHHPRIELSLHTL